MCEIVFNSILYAQIVPLCQMLTEYDSMWKDYDSNVEKLSLVMEYKKLVLSRLASGSGHLIGINCALRQLDALQSEVGSMFEPLQLVHNLGEQLLGQHRHMTSLVISETETRLQKAKNALQTEIQALR